QAPWEIISPPTSVGLRYGRRSSEAERLFLEAWHLSLRRPKSPSTQFSGIANLRIYQEIPPTALNDTAAADLAFSVAPSGINPTTCRPMARCKSVTGKRGHSLSACEVSTNASTRLTWMNVSPSVRGHCSLISTITWRAHCAAVSETSMLGPRLIYP